MDDKLKTTCKYGLTITKEDKINYYKAMADEKRETADVKIGVDKLLEYGYYYGIKKISVERYEQVIKHGYDIKQDNMVNTPEDLKNAAVYALTLNDEFYPDHWDGFMKEKLKEKTREERITIAGAWCAAAISLNKYIRLVPANTDYINQ